MVSSLPPRRKKARSDLIHLRSLLSVLPGTNSGKVTAAWGEIESVLARGIKLREVWEAAKLDGLAILYPQFRVYVSRLRRRQQRLTSAPQLPPALTNVDRGLPDPAAHRRPRSRDHSHASPTIWTLPARCAPPRRSSNRVVKKNVAVPRVDGLLLVTRGGPADGRRQFRFVVCQLPQS